jgi:uncharacterized protein
MSVSPDQIEHERSSGGGRFVLRLPDGATAQLAYVLDGEVATITHTGTPPQHRGQGIAAALVEKAVTEFRAGGRKVIPACWYAREQFRAHPEWADLLAPGSGGDR